MNFGSVDSPGTVKALNKLAAKLEQKNALRVSIDAIKAELRQGRLVTRDRRAGKTSALLEFVHENDPGNTIIVTCNQIMQEMIKRQYEELFPKDAQPRAVSIHGISSHDVQGTNRKWVTDEVWPAAVVNRAPSYAWATFAGGVGTSMCMDSHSGQWLTGEAGEEPESPRSPIFRQVSSGKRARLG